jgi:hypothetical protein
VSNKLSSVSDSRSQALAAVARKLVRAIRDNLPIVGQPEVKDGRFDSAGLVALYEQAFREAGLDVTAVSVEEAAQYLRASTVAEELAAALDSPSGPPPAAPGKGAARQR